MIWSTMNVAFFDKEKINRFVAWIKNPSVETTVFEFCDVMVGTNGDLQSHMFHLNYL